MLREFDKMLCRELGNFPVLIKFVMNLLETFQLGNYPGARFRPLWRFRKMVRRTHHYDRFAIESWCSSCGLGEGADCPKCADSATAADHDEHLCDMCAFVRSVKLEVFLAVKEHFVYQIRCQRTAETLLETELGWIEHVRFVNLACNDARRIMNKAASSSTVRHYEVRRTTSLMLRQLELLHDCNKISNKRLFKTFELYQLFLGKIKRIAGMRCVIANWTGYQQPGDFLVAPLRRAEINKLAEQHPKLKSLLQCDVPLAHLGGARWCDKYKLSQIDALAQFCAQTGDAIISALSMVGLSPEAMRIMQDLHFNSYERDMPDHATERIMVSLFVKHPVDFHIVHYFFTSMDLYDRVRVRPLDAQTAVRQGVAVRLRHHIAHHEPLPPGVDDVYFCRHCRIIYAFVVAPPGNASLEQRRRVNEAAAENNDDFVQLVSTPSARGTPSAFYDTETGQLMCSRNAGSSNTKRFTSTGMMSSSMWVSNVKRARSIRSAREAARPCRNEPLEKVSLLGRILELGGTLYALCVVCGSVCLYTDSNMTDAGPTCGRHFRLRPKGLFQSLRQFVTPRTQQLRSFSHNNVHVLPQSIVAAPKSVKYKSDSRDKLGILSTPVIDGEMFVMVQQEIYRDQNGKGSVLRNVRVEPRNIFYHQQQRAKEEAESAEARERELVERNTRLYRSLGLLRGSTIIVCAICGTRCERNQEFTRITVDNRDGTLVDFLWRRQLEQTGLVDIWLCKNDFNRSLKLLRENPVPLCSELYFSLTEQRQVSLQRVMHRKFRR